MLNGEQILERKLLKLETTAGKVAQVGYDLSIKSIKKVGFQNDGDLIGMVLRDKTQLTTYHPQDQISLEGRIGYLLYPGTYEFTMNEGCKIPADLTARIIHRSSCSRNGVVITSALFDPGFETDNIGTIAIVNEVVFIEQGARVAQIYFSESTEVSVNDLYNGQWQNDKQRHGFVPDSFSEPLTDENFVKSKTEEILGNLASSY